MSKSEPYIFNGMFNSMRYNKFKHFAKKTIKEIADNVLSVKNLKFLHPRCQDGSLDKRFKINNGLPKYGSGGDKIIGKKDQKKNQGLGPLVYLTGYHPTCKDRSLDMRFSVNRGLQKYGNYVFQ